MKPLDTSNRPKGMCDSEICHRSAKTQIKQVVRRACLEAKATNMKTGQQLQRNIATTNSLVILLAEDDREMRVLLARALRQADYKVVECPDGWNLLEHLSSLILHDSETREAVDLIISDIRMPGVTGLEILEGVQQTDGFPPMILITAFGDKETHAQAEKFGAAAMFDKPFEINDLLAKVREIMPLSR
jgi:CheY-like chemotaxis protein